MPDEVSKRSRRSGAAARALARSVARQRSRPGSGPRRPAGRSGRAVIAMHHQDVAELDRLAGRRPATRSTVPARGARSSFCIFIASTASSVCPRVDRVARRDGHGRDPSRDDGTDLERAAGRAGRVAVARGPLPEVGPAGVLDVELEAPAIDDDLDRGRRPSRRAATDAARCGSAGPTTASGRRLDGRRLVAGSRRSSATTVPLARSVTRRRLIAATGRWPPSRPAARQPVVAEAVVVREDGPGSPAARGRTGHGRRGARLRGGLAGHALALRRPVPVSPRPSRSRARAGRERRVARRRTDGTAASSGCPSTSTSSRARRSRSMAAARSAPTAMILAISGS